MKHVILCGGSGTRLWPLSRRLMPKQFLTLFDDKKKSLFQKTIERNASIADKLTVITNSEHYFIALDQLEDLKNEKFNISNTRFLLEETGKNTAPAIAFAALESGEEEILFVTPSDHLIKDYTEYEKAVKEAEKLAEEGYLVTFGITPDEPHTGYGYIEHKGNSVIRFHEKPDKETAEKYFKNGNFLWNSGMFMFKAGVYLKELKKYSPKVYEEIIKSFETRQELDTHARIREMKDIPDISIDYAVMEKSDKIKVVKSGFEWNDVGSFDSLIKEIESIKAEEIECRNNFYYSDDEKKVIAAIGLENYIIIDTKDALLISKKGESQKVKDIVKSLKEKNGEITTSHIKVHRPWGTYEELITDKGYKVKKITVKPGKRLSLQKHFHRSEHWIVVSGTAEVRVGDKTYLVRPNESTYIKMGEIHRLSNPGKIPVILIEAQVGEYLKEDDIVRIEDDYKR